MPRASSAPRLLTPSERLLHKHKTPDFRSKVCLITGAASTVGRATARAMVLHGATLAIADIDAAGLEETNRICGRGLYTASFDVGSSNFDASCKTCSQLVNGGESSYSLESCSSIFSGGIAYASAINGTRQGRSYAPASGTDEAVSQPLWQRIVQAMLDRLSMLQRPSSRNKISALSGPISRRPVESSKIPPVRG